MLDPQSEWEHLLQPFGVNLARAQALFTTLVQAYESPGRVYHTLDHIQTMLEWIERVRSSALHLPAIQLATWFHDCVYDPHASDNEEQSARSAENALSSLGLPDTTIQAVSQMILLTKTHQVDATFRDAQILLDADLAILGAPAPAYAIYAAAIRQEYSWVPELSYKPARAQVLHAFLQRPRIYWTELMYTSLEKQARENVRREIDSLH